MSSRTIAFFILNLDREIPTSPLVLLKLHTGLKRGWDSVSYLRYQTGFSHRRSIHGETVEMVPDEPVDRMVTNRNVGYPRDNKNNKRFFETLLISF